jgi:hypothetical protein
LRSILHHELPAVCNICAHYLFPASTRLCRLHPPPRCEDRSRPSHPPSIRCAVFTSHSIRARSCHAQSLSLRLRACVDNAPAACMHPRLPSTAYFEADPRTLLVVLIAVALAALFPCRRSNRHITCDLSTRSPALEEAVLRTVRARLVSSAMYTLLPSLLPSQSSPFPSLLLIFHHGSQRVLCFCTFLLLRSPFYFLELFSSFCPSTDPHLQHRLRASA